MKRKLCSVLLALCMVLTLLPVSAMADEADTQSATSLPAADENGVITLMENVTLTSTFVVNAEQDLTLDLNGHSLTKAGTVILNNGRLTIRDTTKNGSIVSTNYVAISAGHNSTTTIEYANVRSVEGAVITSYATGATITIKDGVFSASDNAVIAGNGNRTDDHASGKPERVNPNTITINGGEFNGAIKTSGYVACGIYAPWKDNITVNGGTFNITGGAGIVARGGNITVNGGTFNITGGAGIVARGGNVTVNGGTFNTTGNAIGKVGDSRVVVPCSALVFDSEAAYPALTNDSKITVNNGTFNSETSTISTMPKADDTNERVVVNSGTFSDLSALDYLAEGATVTVKLAANTTKDVTIPAGATVTLDLNGHKIVNSATAQDKNVAEDSRKHTITNNGTLTILDSVGGGVVDNVSHGRAALYNAGTIVEIKGGKFTRSVDNSTDATSANGNSWYVIYNAEGANITKISSGEFLALGHFSSLFCNSGTINEISGGTFTQDGFIAFKNEGTVNKISGGTFSSESESCIQNWGTIGEISDGTITAGRIGIWNFSSDTYKSAGTISRITGGNISGTTAAIRLNDYDTDYKDSDKNVKGPSTVNKANASISAGNFSGALEVNAHTVLTITGGTYSVDPSAYVVPGYVASYNGSTYTVYYPVPVTPGNNNNSSSTTTKNPDGSTTTTTTDKTTGTVTETTKNPDGSTTTVETKKDGSVTETNKTANGSVGTVKSDANGNTEISASISAADVNAAAKKNEPVAAPVSVAPAASPAAAPVIKLSVPASAGEVSVAIPVTNAQQGTVAIKVNPDGTEEIIKTAVITENGLVLGVKGSMQIKVINNSKNFADTVGHWAASDVDFVSARELFNGTAPQTFSPESATTRGMVVTVLARLAGESTDGGANWYDKGCAWAVTNGVSDGTDPNGTVTREQLAAMLYRYFGSPAVSGSLSFADASSVSEYAHDAMQWCVNNGIINGMDGLLNPQGQATRAQVSAMFARYIHLAATK